MNLYELCRKLELPELVMDQVLEYEPVVDSLELEPFTEQLFSRDTWKNGLDEFSSFYPGTSGQLRNLWF